MCSIVEICQMYYVVCRHRNFIFKLVDNESTLCFYQISLWIVPSSSCLYLRCRGHCKIKSKSFLHRSRCILFTLSTLLISQWLPTSILHRIYIVSIIYYLNSRHRNVDQHRDVIGLTYYPFYLVYIVNIAMLIINELKLYLHCVPSILFISSTSRCWPTLSRHCVYIMFLFYLFT